MAHLRCAALALLIVLSAAQAMPLGRPAPPRLCPAVLESRDFYRVGRLVTVRLRPECPEGSVAFIRFRSRTGTQPDAPPGHFTLRPGTPLTRLVPYSWWVEEADRLLVFRRVTP